MGAPSSKRPRYASGAIVGAALVLGPGCTVLSSLDGLSGGGGLDAGADGSRPTVPGDGSTADTAPPMPRCDDGLMNGTETDVDCGGVCGATCGEGDGCQADRDCVDGLCRVSDGTCRAPSCTDTVKNQDETDVDCGGICPQCMNGDGCMDNTDCVSGFCQMSDSTCRPSGCADSLMNQDETDVDCGGVCGATCEVDEMCLLDGDCLADFCRPTDTTCQVPTCTDTFQNQDESDVDCGGACGATCTVDETCNLDADCESGFCHPTDSSCQVPTCTDTFQNQDETDVDCGGAVCDPCPTCWGDAVNFNFDDPALDFSSVVDMNCSPTIDTSQPAGSMISGWCGPQPTPVIQAQTGGPGIVVVPMASFLMTGTSTVRLIGDKPVVIAVRGDATINGTIDAGAQGTTPGAGGDDARNGATATDGVVAGADCNVEADGTGEGVEAGTASIGGGGAGFRTNGGFGGGERNNFQCYRSANSYECRTQCPDGSCDNSYVTSGGRFMANNGAHSAVMPVKGLAATDQDLVPLRAGCGGGKGNGSGGDYFGGSGGGALQITVSGTLTLGATAVISAAGGGGTNSGGDNSGSGGGSGGAILIEASSMDVSAAQGIRAHGGAGAGRGCSSGLAPNGSLSADTHANHTGCAGPGGRGGLSYWDSGSAACNGTGASIGGPATCLLPVANFPTTENAYPFGGSFTDNNGGGGGGGSGGVIRLRLLAFAGVCQ